MLEVLPDVVERIYPQGAPARQRLS